MKKRYACCSLIMFFACLLFMFSQHSWAASPPDTIKTELFETWYFNVLSSRKILVLNQTNVYAEQDEKSAMIGTLYPGDKVNILAGDYYVSPTKAIVLEDHIAAYAGQPVIEYEFKAGETFYILNYLGEGNFEVWRNDDIFKVDLRGVKGLTMYGGVSDYWGTLTEEPKWYKGISWAKIESVDGKAGWVKWNKNFGNTKIDGYRGMYIFINGKFVDEFLQHGKKPYANVEGRIFLPLDIAANLIGATVAWDKDSSIATITRQNKILKVLPGKRIAILDGDPFDMDGTPNWRRTTFYVPLQAFCEALGGKFLWDEDARQVSIDLVNG